jgi:hypothetical protein
MVEVSQSRPSYAASRRRRLPSSRVVAGRAGTGDSSLGRADRDESTEGKRTRSRPLDLDLRPCSGWTRRRSSSAFLRSARSPPASEIFSRCALARASLSPRRAFRAARARDESLRGARGARGSAAKTLTSRSVRARTLAESLAPNVRTDGDGRLFDHLAALRPRCVACADLARYRTGSLFARSQGRCLEARVKRPSPAYSPKLCPPRDECATRSAPRSVLVRWPGRDQGARRLPAFAAWVCLCLFSGLFFFARSPARCCGANAAPCRLPPIHELVEPGPRYQSPPAHAAAASRWVDGVEPMSDFASRPARFWVEARARILRGPVLWFAYVVRVSPRWPYRYVSPDGARACRKLRWFGGTNSDRLHSLGPLAIYHLSSSVRSCLPLRPRSRRDRGGVVLVAGEPGLQQARSSTRHES